MLCSLHELALVFDGPFYHGYALHTVCQYWGSNCGGSEILCTRPDRPSRPLNLLYNGYRVSFPGVKQPGRGVDNLPPSSSKVKERVEPNLLFRSGPSWPVLGLTLTFFVSI